ncbi:MAG: cyclopropane-fatty-acyl-phospholipid synthase family protein [marine benthic group bacterium]|nr:cyclopropane-fatty-acyl-phospholipid synthase family protein [Gemmatimonadota bacterium]MCL7970289.1 cyclopropane-fatty-acyl-phospholipid synthase family protein [Gemmatimonadota bacterium]MCL7977260.1 cyclopropane-fatty-acyl-phospholipid synthase family protein [Gemmatimonadota bacterium]
MYLLDRFLRRLIQKGELTLIAPGGKKRAFGGRSPGPRVAIRLHERSLPWKLFLKPELASGEAYMDGTLTIEQGTLREFFDLITSNMGWQPENPLNSQNARIRRVRNFFLQYDSPIRARRSVAHHYDLSNELFRRLLDEEMHYSCAYFTADNPDHDLDRAQRDKSTLTSRKLLLGPGQTVLDIGCGWGALALHLHRRFDVDVTGITLSKQQHAVASERAAEAGVADDVRFHLRDYREISGEFDRIVSVGMFEHVGLPHHREFFEIVRDCLKPDGVALVHTIGRADGPGITDDWTAKYIFPKGYVPALSEIMKSVERAGLYVTDIEVLRLHYAYTLEEWQSRFRVRREEIARMHDERFCRMFEWYLAASEHAFRNMGHVVFQIQLARRQDAVPLTRDYLSKEHECRESS